MYVLINRNDGQYEVWEISEDKPQDFETRPWVKLTDVQWARYEVYLDLHASLQRIFKEGDDAYWERNAEPPNHCSCYKKCPECP